jgi:hypothetical protein
MSNWKTLLMAAMTAACVAAPMQAHAEDVRGVSCSVSVDYLLNGALRAPYQKDFVVDPVLGFHHDFSDRIHWRSFDASIRQVSGNTVMLISYYNEQGAFVYIDLSTRLTLRDGTDGTISGRSSHYNELGGGEHTTDFSLTCSRLK